jgi:hypothetical protein
MSEAQPWITPEKVREALPAVDAALFALSAIPVLQPYALAARAVTGAGQLILPNEQKNLLIELKRAYAEFKAAREFNDEAAVLVANARMHLCIELLVKNVQEA